ncbi:cytochrome-c peroxidase [Pseudohongiella spirulinae]|uniref:Putative cytochrome-c peroxidase n=1 Tax=Pseudohongiella spirulinae TaxID=1249552 RepID=A0A0S2KGN9_9GAMM|nr:cytochrome c peroxidase [Pseudohongiella spirulinae]ALO47483.1 Putative cytochrome-c peroxidase [Pseudohongiella spirulinae]
MNFRVIKATLILSLTAGLAYLGWQTIPAPLPDVWSAQQRALIESLWIENLPELLPDPSNRYADNALAAEFGRQLFFDARLSRTGNISCATCHIPESGFTDNKRVASGIEVTDRNTMPLAGAAYSHWYFWDGRKDSLWSQALEPLENPKEHGLTRDELLDLIQEIPEHLQRYQALFGPLPDPSLASREQVNMAFANLGKALAAYQRNIMPGPAPFDDYVASLQTTDNVVTGVGLDDTEISGLRLFISKAQCVNCHNGPLFTNNDFHNTAVLSAPGQAPAAGRSQGLRLARQDPFNCLGIYSDAGAGDCPELTFAREGDELIGAQRTASLRNLAATAPYMHAGQFDTLDQVIEHYNAAQIAVIGHNEAKPLKLRSVEKRQLRAFLDTLNGPIYIKGSSAETFAVGSVRPASPP